MFEERQSDSPHIQFVWRATVSESGSFEDLAHDFWVLVFRTSANSETQVILTGPVTKAETIHYEAGQVNWGIALRSHVFVTGLPKKELLDTRTVLTSLGNTFWLGDHELQIPTYETAEKFVDQLVSDGLLNASLVIADALAGNAPYMSERNLQRQYSKVTGLTRSQTEQIQRARQAFVLLEQGMSIIDASQQAGYADQAHMTRALKLLAGQTPGQIIRDYYAS